MDHLDGFLHIDKAEQLFVMPAEERKKFRLSNGYKIISEDGDYEKLISEKTKRKNRYEK